MDREKVIKAIDICLGHGKCDDCGYRIKGGYSTMDCRKPMMCDALALLKEQEAKTPVEYEHNGYWYYICPTCGNHDEELLRQWNYCPFCGQAVRWHE